MERDLIRISRTFDAHSEEETGGVSMRLPLEGGGCTEWFDVGVDAFEAISIAIGWATPLVSVLAEIKQRQLERNRAFDKSMVSVAPQAEGQMGGPTSVITHFVAASEPSSSLAACGVEPYCRSSQPQDVDCPGCLTVLAEGESGG